MRKQRNMAQMREENKTPGKALTGVTQWIECQPANQRVTSSIPSQGTCLGFGPGTW